MIEYASYLTEQEHAQLRQALKALARDTSDWSPQTPTPRQKLFLDLEHKEAFFGGAAGPGKSSALLIAALEYVHIPGYSALLLRRTFADLNKRGALMDRMREWLTGTDAVWNEQSKTWRFPSGATISFGYLDTENDKLKYQGAEYQFCVAVGTPVLMADGKWQSIESIKVGDRVATLVGPRRVLKTFRPGKKRVVRIETPRGAVVASETHRIFSEYGWASPLELRSIESRASHNIRVFANSLWRGLSRQLWSIYQDLERVAAPILRTLAQTPLPANGVSSVTPENGCGVSGDSRRESPLPEKWYGRIGLLSPDALSNGFDVLGRVSRHDLLEFPPTGCSDDYSHESRLCDARSHGVQEVDRVRTQRRDGAEERGHRLHSDDQARTHARIHLDQATPVHPYTSATMDGAPVVPLVRAEMARAGESEVADLQVEEASHYIAWPGIISSNCGFDELTQFSESQYLYLFSRLRRLATADIPIRMRSASNPGGPGANWVRSRFIPADYTPGQSVDLRTFEVEGIDPDGFPVRRAFVPARMEDNPYLDQAEYRQSLNELDAVTREQLLAGDWSIQERGNIYPMWNELDHVITWSQFEKVYGQPSIPNTWQLGIGHDVGFTEGHPYVVSFVATSPENSKLPGRKFLFRELCGYEATAREIGQRIKDVMTVGEKDRVRTWLMSHEAASERAEYSRVHGLHFSSWKPDKNGGISQVRDYLELQNLDSPNPFKPHRRGQPWLYFVVPDDQLVNPTEERGLARHRAEMPVYRYGTLRSGDEKHVVAPHPLFNDAMDALRGLASEDFAPMLRLSPVEVAVRNLKSKGTLLTDAVLAQIDDAAQSVAVLSHMQNLQRELQQAESDFGPIFNPRLRSGDQ